MSQNTKVGIDIGTYQVKVVVAEAPADNGRHLPRILGVGFAESKGLRHGYILNPNETFQSIKNAIHQAEKSSGIKIKRAYLSLGGIGLNSFVAHGGTTVTRADSEITDLDVEKAIATSENDIPKSAMMNRKIIHTIPIEYKIDGKSVLGRPHGLKGMRLEVRTLFITSLEHHVNDLISTLEENGIEVEDVIASPLAASLVTITKLQKMAGCVLANVGAETVSIVVFENNIPVSLEVFPIGSTDITNDIALGLKIPLEEAEDIKTGRMSDTNYSKRKLDEIINARLSDIFELIEAHLKKIGRSGLLPAGIILTGGGSGLGTITDFARANLKLPSKVASFNFNTQSKVPIKDATWAVAYGLCILGFSNGEEEKPLGLRLAKKTGKTLKEWVKQFLP
jgi:cell division protein FtsA